ncbi:unnamed protein product [[Actinomadura] parvosata subsp. kistnae]|nr:unnamed protein product [Actinomadura parvosata subsp. kistnae]
MVMLPYVFNSHAAGAPGIIGRTMCDFLSTRKAKAPRARP